MLSFTSRKRRWWLAYKGGTSVKAFGRKVDESHSKQVVSRDYETTEICLETFKCIHSCRRAEFVLGAILIVGTTEGFPKRHLNFLMLQRKWSTQKEVTHHINCSNHVRKIASHVAVATSCNSKS